MTTVTCRNHVAHKKRCAVVSGMPRLNIDETGINRHFGQGQGPYANMFSYIASGTTIVSPTLLPGL